ncbi:MAG: hypothetical protein ABW061_07340 [Polyangiaceae bacterium]
MLEILRGRTWQELPNCTVHHLEGNHYSLTVRNMSLTGLRRYDDKTFRIDGQVTAAVLASEHDSGTWKIDAWVS